MRLEVKRARGGAYLPSNGDGSPWVCDRARTANASRDSSIVLIAQHDKVIAITSEDPAFLSDVPSCSHRRVAACFHTRDTTVAQCCAR